MEHPLNGATVVELTLGVAIHNLNDPNFDTSATAIKDESPYPEVRSAVSNTDDPTMPSSTFRSWVIGLILVVPISGMNQFLDLRYPGVYIAQSIPMVLSFLVGKAWARYLPNISLFGIPLNPGPFTIKEHAIIFIMNSAGAGSAYAINIISVQKVLYNQHVPFGYQWLLVMSTQLIGFSIGGICKRFLVQPPSMIWPENLATATLLSTLHSQETSRSRAHGGISRKRFFSYIFVGYIFYTPHNATINQLFGVTHGLAMGVLTFDWGQITAFTASPLSNPWWAMANCGITIALFFWILLPILYYSNVWYSAYLPMVSSDSFDNTGNIYNVSRIINSDFSFNLQAYKEYSPLFIPASFAITYGLSFASAIATFTHTFLYYRKQLWTRARPSLSEQPDIHARLMSVYNNVPDWWYLITFVTMSVFGVVVIEVWDTQLPVWAFVLALLISFMCTVPFGVIMAMANQQVGLSVITELIIGYALPGRQIAMMMFKTWGSVTMHQALEFTDDFKLAHYMKIPPRPMFFCQLVATIVAGTTQLGVRAWMFSNIEDICSPNQKDGFICPGTTVFGTASIIWGVIGPKRLFSHGHLYLGLFSFFLAGALAPFLQWILHIKFGFDFLKYLNFPLVFTGASSLPPATPLNYVPAVLVCFIFNYVVRRRHFDWWSKYNYVLSSGLDAGYEFGILIVFIVLQYPKNGNIGLNSIQTWWGNTVYTKTDDFAGVPYKSPPDGGTFGPSSW